MANEVKDFTLRCSACSGSLGSQDKRRCQACRISKIPVRWKHCRVAQLCYGCGARVDRTSTGVCAACHAKRNSKMQSYRKRQKEHRSAQNLCQKCGTGLGEPATASMCTVCRERARQVRRNWRQRRLAAGLCLYCGETLRGVEVRLCAICRAHSQKPCLDELAVFTKKLNGMRTHGQKLSGNLHHHSTRIVGNLSRARANLRDQRTAADAYARSLASVAKPHS